MFVRVFLWIAGGHEERCQKEKTAICVTCEQTHEWNGKKNKKKRNTLPQREQKSATPSMKESKVNWSKTNIFSGCFPNLISPVHLSLSSLHLFFFLAFSSLSSLKPSIKLLVSTEAYVSECGRPGGGVCYSFRLTASPFTRSPILSSTNTFKFKRPKKFGERRQMFQASYSNNNILSFSSSSSLFLFLTHLAFYSFYRAPSVSSFISEFNFKKTLIFYFCCSFPSLWKEFICFLTPHCFILRFHPSIRLNVV